MWKTSSSRAEQRDAGRPKLYLPIGQRIRSHAIRSRKTDKHNGGDLRQDGPAPLTPVQAEQHGWQSQCKLRRKAGQLNAGSSDLASIHERGRGRLGPSLRLRNGPVDAAVSAKSGGTIGARTPASPLENEVKRCVQIKGRAIQVADKKKFLEASDKALWEDGKLRETHQKRC